MGRTGFEQCGLIPAFLYLNGEWSDSLLFNLVLGRGWPATALDRREALRGADFVVNAADWPAHDIERWTNAACVAAGLPYVTMSHSPPVARVGPLYVPGTTGCWARGRGDRWAHARTLHRRC